MHSLNKLLLNFVIHLNQNSVEKGQNRLVVTCLYQQDYSYGYII